MIRLKGSPSSMSSDSFSEVGSPTINDGHEDSFVSGDDSDASDVGVQSLPVHPLIHNQQPGARRPLSSPPSATPSSLSSSFGSEALAPTLSALPPAPTLDRLQHLRRHLKQLKQLYRQEVHQEELACRDSLLQTVCTSSVTLLRHCASTERFFTAAKALLTQYLPAASAKLFEVVECDGRAFLVSPKRDGAGVDTVQLSSARIEWGSIGIAGRAVAAAQALREHNIDSQIDSTTPKSSPMGCEGVWLEKVSGFGSANQNENLVLRIPVSQLLPVGYRAEVDLSPVPLSSEGDPNGQRRRRPRHRSQELLVVVLRDSTGQPIGAFEAFLAKSQSVNTELIDVMGVLIVAAIQARRAVCRSPISSLCVEIGQQTTNAHRSSIRVPIPSNTVGPWEICASGDGAVLEELDSTMLNALGKPLARLLDEMEAQNIEISTIARWSKQLEHLWLSMKTGFSVSNNQEARSRLRQCIEDFVMAQLKQYDHNNSNSVLSISHVRILFEDENASRFRAVYADHQGSDRNSVENDYAALEQVLKTQCLLDSSTAIARAFTTDQLVIDEAASTSEAGSVVAILVRLSASQDGSKECKSLVKAVKNFLLPLLELVVKVFDQAVRSFRHVQYLRCKLNEVSIAQDSHQHLLALIDVVEDVANSSIGSSTTTDLIQWIYAAKYPNIVAGMTLFAVEQHADKQETLVWTIVEGKRVIVASESQTLTPDDAVHLVLGRNRTKILNSAAFADRDTNRYIAIPLIDPQPNCCLGVIEFKFESAVQEASFQPVVGSITSILGGVMKRQEEVGGIRSKFLEDLKGQSEKYFKLQEKWAEFVSKWSLFPLSDSLSTTTWIGAIENLCRELLPSIDFVNLFLCFETEGSSKPESNSQLAGYVRDFCINNPSGEVYSDIRRELGLFNQSVLGTITHYLLTTRNEVVGVIFISKRANEDLSTDEDQLMRMGVTLIKYHVVNIKEKFESQKYVQSLKQSLVDRSAKLQDLSSLNKGLSKRKQQLLALHEVTKAGCEIETIRPGAESSMLSIKSILQEVLRRLSSVQFSNGSKEICFALIIEQVEERQLADLLRPDASSITFEVSDEDRDWLIKCSKLACAHHFQSLPPRMRHCLSSFVQWQQQDCFEVVHVAPIDLTDKTSNVFLMVVSSKNNPTRIVDDMFMKELGEAVDYALQHIYRINSIVVSASSLKATLDSSTQQLECVYQDYRLQELANIVWMEVMSYSSPKSTADPIEETKNLASYLEDSFNRRIISFLREDLQIMSIALVIENPSINGVPASSHVDQFIAALDSAQSSAILASSNNLVFGSDHPRSNNSRPRSWILQRIVLTDSSECIGAFYVEWEPQLDNGASVSSTEAIRPELLWVADWIQSLVRFFHNHCLMNTRIASKTVEVNKLLIQDKTHLENIGGFHKQESRWKTAIEFSRALWTLEFDDADTSAQEDLSVVGSASWDFLFSELSRLSADNTEFTVWARGVREGKDVAWTVRGGSKTCESMDWKKLLHDKTHHPELYHDILHMPTSQLCGAIECSRNASESIWNLAKMLATNVSSFLHKRRLQKSNQRLQGEVKSVQDGVALINQRWKKMFTQNQMLFEAIEAAIQQLVFSSQPIYELRHMVQRLLHRVEKEIKRVVSIYAAKELDLRYLLQLNDNQGRVLMSACGPDCLCESPTLNESTRTMLDDLLDRAESNDNVRVTHILASDDVDRTGNARKLLFPPCRHGTGGKRDRITAVDVFHDTPRSEETEEVVNIQLTLLCSVSEAGGDDYNTHLTNAMKMTSRYLANAIAALFWRVTKQDECDKLRNDLEVARSDNTNERTRYHRVMEAAQMAALNIKTLLHNNNKSNEVPVVQGAMDSLAGCSFMTSSLRNSPMESITTRLPVSKDTTTEIRLNNVTSEVDEVSLISKANSGHPNESSALSIDEMVVNVTCELTTAVNTFQSYKKELESHERQNLAEISRLQSKVERMETNCLELKSALEKSEKQFMVLKTRVRNGLDPFAGHAIELMSSFKNENSKSLAVIAERLSNALTKIDGACGVLVRVASESQKLSGESSRTLLASPPGFFTGKQALISEHQLQEITERCIVRQETEVLSLRPSKTAPEIKRWVILSPIVVYNVKAACIVLVDDCHPCIASSRRELFQVNHVRLLCQIACWISEHLESERVLQDQCDNLHVQHKELIRTVQNTSRQLEQFTQVEKKRKHVLESLTRDTFHALGWSERAWSKILPSKRKLAVAWSQLTRLCAERLSSQIRPHGTMHIQLYGVARAQAAVFHLPQHIDSTREGFGFTSFMTLSQSQSTRHLWDAVMAQESRTINDVMAIPVLSSCSPRSTEPSPVAIVEMAVMSGTDENDLNDCAATARELVEMLAPFIEGIVSAVLSVREVVHKVPVNHRQRIEMQGFHHKAVHEGGAFYNEDLSQRTEKDGSRSYRKVTSALPVVSDFKNPLHLTRDHIVAEDDCIDDSGSCTSDMSETHRELEKRCTISERLISFLLELQCATSLKSLHRMVADKVSMILSQPRCQEVMKFEVVELSDTSNNQREDEIDSVQSELLPQGILKQVVSQMNSSDTFDSNISPPILKLRDSDRNEYWIAMLHAKIMSSNRTDSSMKPAKAIGLMIGRVSPHNMPSNQELQTVFQKIAVAVERQLGRIQRDLFYQHQLTSFEQMESNSTELTSKFESIERECRYVESFTKLAVQLSNARSEREVIRRTTKYLREEFGCGVVFEPHCGEQIANKTEHCHNNDGDDWTEVEILHSLGDKEANTNSFREDDSLLDVGSSSSGPVDLRHTIKLKIFSTVAASTSRLRGTFSVFLEPSVKVSYEHHQKLFKNVVSIVTSAFDRLQAAGMLHQLRKEFKTTAHRFGELKTERDRLQAAFKEQAGVADELQRQFDSLVRINSDMETEIGDLRSRLYESEERRANNEAEMAAAHDQLRAVATSHAREDESTVVRLQEEISRLQGRERVLEKRNVKRRLQMQQLVEEISRLKKAEEVDKFRISELEKQLAVSNGRQQPIIEQPHAAKSVAVAETSNTKRHLSTMKTERHVDLQKQHERQMQRMKQLRLAEELRCLAALEVREINTRQHEQSQLNSQPAKVRPYQAPRQRMTSDR